MKDEWYRVELAVAASYVGNAPVLYCCKLDESRTLVVDLTIGSLWIGIMPRRLIKSMAAKWESVVDEMVLNRLAKVKG